MSGGASSPELAFDARALVGQKGGEGYLPIRDSVGLGWASTLLQVGARNDASGSAELGASHHPRLLFASRGMQAVRRRDLAGEGDVHFAAGRTWLVPPGASYGVDWRGQITPEREMALLTLPRSVLSEIAGAMSEQDRRHVAWTRVSLVDDVTIAAVMRNLIGALTIGRDELYAESAGAFLLHHVLTFYADGTNRALRAGHEDARIRSAIEYMQDRLEIPLTLAAIAHHVGLSTYHFIRIFHEATGDPPRKYLTRLRVEAAARRLANPELSITAIAAIYGFSDGSHFATAFRREKGMSPRDYRSQLLRG